MRQTTVGREKMPSQYGTRPCCSLVGRSCSFQRTPQRLLPIKRECEPRGASRETIGLSYTPRSDLSHERRGWGNNRAGKFGRGRYVEKQGWMIAAHRERDYTEESKDTKGSYRGSECGHQWDSGVQTSRKRKRTCSEASEGIEVSDGYRFHAFQDRNRERSVCRTQGPDTRLRSAFGRKSGQWHSSFYNDSNECVNEMSFVASDWKPYFDRKGRHDPTKRYACRDNGYREKREHYRRSRFHCRSRRPSRCIHPSKYSYRRTSERFYTSRRDRDERDPKLDYCNRSKRSKVSSFSNGNATYRSKYKWQKPQQVDGRRNFRHYSRYTRRDAPSSRERRLYSKRKKNDKCSAKSQKLNRKDGDDIVHFSWRPGMKLSNRLTVKGLLGEGTFGRVLECEDRDLGIEVGVKIVRDIDRYTSAAKIESQILSDVRDRDPNHDSNCVVLFDQFLYDSRLGASQKRSRLSSRYKQMRSSSDDRELTHEKYGEGKHMCLVFEKLGLSLFAFLSQNNYRGFFLCDIQQIARETLKALSFLYELRLTHTDLKPENILFINSKSNLVEFPRSRHPSRFWDGDASETESSSASEVVRSASFSKSKRIEALTNSNGLDVNDSSFRPSFLRQLSNNINTSRPLVMTKRPIDCRVKLIDFGSATYDDDDHCSLINTRQYRAPEVILQIGWSMPSDIWCLGCILVELYTGVLLFRTHDHMEHLAMIERIIGPIPISMLKAAQKSEGKKYLTLSERSLRLNWPEGASNHRSINRVSRCLPLRNTVLPQHSLFSDFLQHLLVVDPNNRPTPIQAMQHPFLHTSLPES